MLMKKSEVKTCTGNGLLDIWGLVIVYSGGTLSPILIGDSYQTHVIEVVKYMCDNLYPFVKFLAIGGSLLQKLLQYFNGLISKFLA